jgi:hypothetical protein
VLSNIKQIKHPSGFYFDGLVESRKGRFVIVPQVVGQFDNTIDLSSFI